MSSAKQPTALFLSVMCALSLGACGWMGQPATVADSSQSSAGQQALLSLTGSQQLRDQLARSEFAIEISASELAELATECERCAHSLSYTAESAEARLQVVGGLWEPWALIEPDQQSGLPQLPEVGEAPMTPEELVGYMHASALDQLQGLLAVEELEPGDRKLLASVLAGRLLSARYLASTFGVNVEDAASHLPQGATATVPDTPIASAERTATAPGDVPQSGNTETAELLRSAIVSYDCVGTSIGFSTLPDSDYFFAQSLYDDLLARREVLEAFAGSPGAIRCVLSFPDDSSLVSEMLAADLNLFSSDDAAVLELAQQWLLEDIQTAATVGDISPLTPGLTHRSTLAGQEDTSE